MNNTLHRILSDSFRFSKREFVTRYRESFLGYLWIILNPLLMVGLFVLVFGYIFDGSFTESESKVEYGIGIFIGLTIYGLFAETLGVAPRAILAKRNLVEKVVFPLEIVPITGWLVCCYRSLIALVLAILLCQFYGELSLRLIFVTVLLIPVLAISCGLFFIFSALGVYFRDIDNIANVLNRALLFISAVFYPLESVPESIRKYLVYNPVALCIDSIRGLVLWGDWPSVRVVIYLVLVSVVTLAVGIWVFRRTKSGFADVL